VHGRPGVQKAVRLEVPPYVGEWLPESPIRDLIRTDRDPAWPLILAQLAGRAPDPLACDAPLAAAVAAQAAAQGLAFIDRAAAAGAVTNGTLELFLPGGSGAAERGRLIKTARVAALTPAAENRILASRPPRRTGIQATLRRRSTS
jgi:hypothetical protein